MLSTRTGFRLGVVLALLTATHLAWSNENGITGFSGKSGSICTTCHNDPGSMPVPTVELEGPTALDAGSKAVYTFRITTPAPATGMNAAVSADDATLAAVDGGKTDESGNEIMHQGATPTTGGSAVYQFELTAPQYGGPIRLYAAGNAVDGEDGNAGDNAAGTSIQIDVSGPPRPPEPPPAPPPPQPAPVPVGRKDAGSSSSAPRASAPADDDSGCAIGREGDSSVPAGTLALAVLGVAAVTRRRRR